MEIIIAQVALAIARRPSPGDGPLTPLTGEQVKAQIEDMLSNSEQLVQVGEVRIRPAGSLESTMQGPKVTVDAGVLASLASSLAKQGVSTMPAVVDVPAKPSLPAIGFLKQGVIEDGEFDPSLFNDGGGKLPEPEPDQCYGCGRRHPDGMTEEEFKEAFPNEKDRNTVRRNRLEPILSDLPSDETIN